MKQIWLYGVRTYMQLALFFYYRRIHVFDVKNVPKNKPILLVSNHNNALIDALLIATQSGRFSYFLTRASVFQKPWVDTVLRSLNMLPVYRIRDGWSSLSNNNSIFKTCGKLLSKRQAVTLFPEGNHHINRTVRPLSKGFTRIIFETLEAYPETDLQLVPIGLNFEQIDAFADSVSIYFGKPIRAQTYLKADKHAETLHLKEAVSHEIKQLTTHIPSDSYDAILKQLESVEANFLEPKKVNKCIQSNFDTCDFKKVKKPVILKRFFKLLMIINLFLPYLIWKWVAEPKVKEVEFMATFRFAIAISLVPIWVVLVGVALTLTLGFSYAGLYLLTTLAFTLLTVKL